MNSPTSLALFCRVVDNFGDIGVCWRLARQLVAEYQIKVQLWVDDLHSFHHLCNAIAPQATRQMLDGVDVIAWRDALPPDVVAADVVIEGFGCHLPPEYIALMAARQRPPVWINLEYLSAEDWVESCHGLPSPHPQTGLNKYFFFPGFSAGTGGLLAERDLPKQRDAFVQDVAVQAAFWAGLDVYPQPGERIVTMFCYPHAPLLDLLHGWQQQGEKILCLVPQGVALDSVAIWMQQAMPGSTVRLQVLPFVAQAQYDKMLWAADINFVRGEDSFVRAQWAARPFIWQIYPQQENIHLEKLQAFLARYSADLPDVARQACENLWLGWNGSEEVKNTNIAKTWPDFVSHRESLVRHGQTWAQMLAKNGDLAANLVQFMQKIG